VSGSNPRSARREPSAGGAGRAFSPTGPTCRRENRAAAGALSARINQSVGLRNHHDILFDLRAIARGNSSCQIAYQRDFGAAPSGVFLRFIEAGRQSRCLAAAVDDSYIGVGWMISWQSPVTLIATLSVCRGFVAMMEMAVRPQPGNMGALTMSKRVADVLIETLQAAGVKRCYGIVGDTLNRIAHAIQESKIEWVHVRREEAGAFAASAEGQFTGELVDCAGSCGPGSLHFIDGLYEADRNRAPVICEYVLPKTGCFAEQLP
jgi:hypothetical protein